MPLRKFKPTSPGRRFMTIAGFEEITTDEPEKTLVESLPTHAGRNNQGRITTRHQGGGYRKLYRKIDFKRDKHGIAGKVATIEYDPNRSARIALIHYKDGEKRYILAPLGLKVGDPIESGRRHRFESAMRSRWPTSPSAPPSTTSSSPWAAAASWSARRARRPSCWRRKATTRWCACLQASCVESTCAARPRSARSVTSSTRTNRGARQAAAGGSESGRLSAVRP